MAKGHSSLHFLFSLFFGLVVSTVAPATPLDFNVLKQIPADTPLAKVRKISTFDGSNLAYRQYVPRDPRGLVVLFHAAGLHSAVGLNYLAYHLAKEQRVVVVTPDMRGHGASDGEPGDAPKQDSYMMDMDNVLAYATYAFPKMPLLVGVHSSASALMLNYLEWTKRKDIRGVVFIAPYLGPKAKLERVSNPPLVQIHKAGMAMNKSTLGLACRHCKGLTLDLPHVAKITYRPLVTEFTVAAARAFSTSNPLLQVRKLRLPYAVLVGAKDEWIQGGRTKQFFKLNGRTPWMMKNEMVPNATHLSILFQGKDQIGGWVDQMLAQPPQ